MDQNKIIHDFNSCVDSISHGLNVVDSLVKDDNEQASQIITLLNAEPFQDHLLSMLTKFLDRNPTHL